MSPRYIYRLILAFLKRFKAIIAIGILLGVAFFLLLSIFLPNIESVNEKVGLVGRFTTDNLPEEIAEKLSSGLTSIEDDGNVAPAIAKSWETTDDGKTWVFTIDENVTWHDGKKIKAADINYIFDDAAVEIIDDKTIKFNLDSKFAAFPVIVSKPLFKRGLLGTGAWKVKNISLTGGFVQKLILTDEKKNKITYKFYPSEDRLRLAFKLGEVDTLGNLSTSAPFDTWKTVNVTSQTSFNNFVAIFINTENEKFKDKSIRQALAYAIDKNNLAGERALGPISPNSWGYNPQVKPYLKDSEKTKELKDLKIKLSTLPNLLKEAEKIEKDLEESGVEVEIETVSDVPENYECLLATVDIPKDPDQYSLWHSTQTATNISKYKNPRIDKLLEDGRTELDKDSRKKIYIDFQRFLVEDVPAIFLYHPTLYTISRK